MNASNLPMAKSSLVLRRSGAQHLRQAAWTCWLLLVAGSLLVGVSWRISGRVPAFESALDGAGLALWCTAWWLAPAWEQLLDRQRRHTAWLAYGSLLAVQNALVGFGYAVLLSLAPLGLLLAYDGGAVVVRLLALLEAFSSERVELLISQGWLAGLSLLLSGPLIIIVSTALLIIARRWLKQGLGTALWVAAAAAVHLHLLRSEPWWPVPLGPGRYVEWFLNQGRDSVQGYQYISQVLVSPVKIPLLLLLCCVILLALLSIRGRRYTDSSELPWLPAFSALLLPAVVVATDTWQWVADTSRLLPGDWRQVFAIGLTALCAVSWLVTQRRFNDAKPGIGVVNLAWLPFTAAAWVCFTLPYFLADAVGRPEVLATAAVCLLAGTAYVLGFIRLAMVQGLPAGWRRTLQLLLLAALLIPPGQGYSLAVELPLSLTETLFSGRDPASAILVMGCLGAALLALTPWSLLTSRPSRIRLNAS